jgi:hypothetical protein
VFLIPTLSLVLLASLIRLVTFIGSLNIKVKNPLLSILEIYIVGTTIGLDILDSPIVFVFLTRSTPHIIVPVSSS